MTKQQKVVDDEYKHGADCVNDGESERAIEIFTNCIAQYREMNNWEGVAKSLNAMGVAYEDMGSRDMSLDCYLDSLVCSKEHGLSDFASVVNQSVGTGYYVLGEYEEALKYFNESLDEMMSLNLDMAEERNGMWYTVCYLNIGITYLKMGNLDLAEMNINKSIDVAEKIGYDDFEFAVKVNQLILKHYQGDSNYVQENIPKLIELAKRNQIAASDYDVMCKEFFDVLIEVGSNEQIRTFIDIYDKYVRSMENATIELTVTEFWIKYYQKLNDAENYRRSCVEYSRLCKLLQEQETREKIKALNVKMDLERITRDEINEQEHATFDELTKLKNRYAMNANAEVLFKRLAEENKVAMVEILDIDCFKEYNDTYGHVVGDKLLKNLGELIKGILKGVGDIYRFGGDEFIIIIPENEIMSIEDVATEVRNVVYQKEFKNEKSTVSDRVTLSQGGFICVPSEEKNLDYFIDKADEALYEVKENGRNNFLFKSE